MRIWFKIFNRKVYLATTLIQRFIFVMHLILMLQYIFGSSCLVLYALLLLFLIKRGEKNTKS